MGFTSGDLSLHGFHIWWACPHGFTSGGPPIYGFHILWSNLHGFHILWPYSSHVHIWCTLAGLLPGGHLLALVSHRWMS